MRSTIEPRDILTVKSLVLTLFLTALMSESVEAQFIPTITAPTITAPTITAPTITAPTVAVPTITAPTITAPTVAVPTITAPTITAPTVAVPTITINPVIPSQNFQPENVNFEFNGDVTNSLVHSVNFSILD